MASRIEQLKAKQAQLAKRIAHLQHRESASKRKLDDRRKIILGGWLLKHRPDLVANIVRNLDREQDQRAFSDWTAADSGSDSSPNAPSTETPDGRA